jgi:hypothetical protein
MDSGGMKLEDLTEDSKNQEACHLIKVTYFCGKKARNLVEIVI